MKIIINESIFDNLKANINNLCRDFFVGSRRGFLQLHVLPNGNENYYAIVLLPDGSYGFIPKSAYKGIKKVEVKYNNGTTRFENRSDVDETDVIVIDNANIEQLNTLRQIIVSGVMGFNSNLKYTNV